MRHPEKYYMKDVKRTLRSLIDKGNNIIDFFYMKNNVISGHNENTQQLDCGNSINRAYEKINERQQYQHQHSYLNDNTNNTANTHHHHNHHHNHHHHHHHNHHQLRMTSSHCAWLHCTIGSLNADEFAILRLRFRVWSRNLAIVSTK
jgi:G3E family GTPase